MKWIPRKNEIVVLNSYICKVTESISPKRLPPDSLEVETLSTHTQHTVLLEEVRPARLDDWFIGVPKKYTISDGEERQPLEDVWFICIEDEDGMFDLYIVSDKKIPIEAPIHDWKSFESTSDYAWVAIQEKYLIPIMPMSEHFKYTSKQV